MTELERLQKVIDDCRKFHGDNSCWDCDCIYAKRGIYESCPKIVAHSSRMDYCRKNNIPIEKW